ncbi:MAG TPA: glycosyltransferase family 39 protein [Casimicrobiaceae bacterium]|nr:glycosyltransferase family 39 protein [Casimicrobiaceae bacterium]
MTSRFEHARGPSRGWLVNVWALVIVYFTAGVFGRALWKADEPYSFGIIWEMLQDHQWLIPHIAGQPFVEKPPLVYWLGAVAAKALPTLRPDESARLVVLLFAAIGAGALYAGARRLHREALAWLGFVGAGNRAAPGAEADPDAHAYATLGLLLMVGTLGFAEHVHKLTADIGQLAGAILGLSGLIFIGTSGTRGREARAIRRPEIAGGVMLGTGAGIAFMSKGLLVPGVLATTWALLLPLPDYRSRAARLGIAIAVTTALPWLVVWPTLFHAASPDLFREWLWGNNVGRFLGSTLLGGNHRTLGNKLASMFVASLPAVLLLPVALWRSLRAAVSNPPTRTRNLVRLVPGHAAVALFLAVSATVLATSASMRDVYILPLLPAVVLLGLPVLLLEPGASSATSRRVAIVTFGALAALVAAAWMALVTTGSLAHAPRLDRLVERTLPLPYSLAVSWPAVVVALATLVAWSCIVRRDMLRSPVVAWAAGFAMLWVVTAALLLPWIDAARSYQGVFAQIGSRVANPGQCVGALNLGESELSMLEYVTGIEATRAYLGHSGDGNRADPNPAVQRCDWLIALSSRRLRAHPDAQRWRPVWTVSRPADRNERFTLYRAADLVDPKR